MFKIIGELINTTREKVKEATARRDAAFIQELAKKQIEAGADWIDVNGGARAGHEEQDMTWLLEVVQAVSGDVALSVDSNNPDILAMAYKKVRAKPMINSISLERKRWEGLSPFLKGKDCDILALCMDDTGLPKSLDNLLERADRLVSELKDIGFAHESIYIDPLIQPISTDITKGKMAMEAVAEIMKRYPGIHTVCGASNISFGMPVRRLINRYFITMMIAHGLDTAILDPLDGKTIEAVMTANMLAGGDRFCMSFLKAVREGKIGN
jgi:cobalamin-dependent methionine synthase I